MCQQPTQSGQCSFDWMLAFGSCVCCMEPLARWPCQITRRNKKKQILIFHDHQRRLLYELTRCVCVLTFWCHWVILHKHWNPFLAFKLLLYKSSAPNKRACVHAQKYRNEWNSPITPPFHQYVPRLMFHCICCCRFSCVETNKWQMGGALVLVLQRLPHQMLFMKYLHIQCWAADKRGRTLTLTRTNHAFEHSMLFYRKTIHATRRIHASVTAETVFVNIDYV